MNFWWRFGLVALAVVVVFNAGFYLKGKFEEADQAEVLREQIRANAAKQDKMDAAARRTESDLIAERRKNAENTRKWSRIRETENHTVCTLDDDTLGLLRDVANPAGQPLR